MAAFWCSILFFILGVLVNGQENAGAPLDENVRGAVTRAVQWMMDQRRDDYSWGAFTPRAVVALSLSQEVVPFSKDEMTIMTKQLNILLSLELGRNLSTKSMGLSRLALYVNALFATCQDPRNFHGLDLVRILRTRTDSAMSKADFNLPVVFMPLCLAQEIRHHDVNKIDQMYRNYRNKTDLQALTLLGLSCIAQQNRSAITKQHLESLRADFGRHFHSIAPSDDVYTLALYLQVARAVSGSPVDTTSLIEKQSADGSFGSLLGTYYALPALLGKNVFTKVRHCNKKSSLDHSMNYPLSERSSPKVYYSVWVGEGDTRDSHTVTVAMPSFNRTLFDVMQMARNRNPNFRFNYEETKVGKRVYSLAGTPNDVQRELYWILYVTKGEPRGFHSQMPMQKISQGVDRIYPAPEDHYIFWFRRHAPY